jgi:hypothetical protein
MDFKLSICMDNWAFEGCQGVELGRILRELASKVDIGDVYDGSETGRLQDINGNQCGSWEVIAPPKRTSAVHDLVQAVFRRAIKEKRLSESPSSVLFYLRFMYMGVDSSGRDLFKDATTREYLP